MTKLSWRIAPVLGAILLCGCSTVHQRKRERADAYRELSSAQQQLVDRGQIERGMDTNAVYLAWGSPSSVIESAGGPGSESYWIYFATKAVLFPTWKYVPDARGIWTFEPTTLHYSQKFKQAEVQFTNGHVVSWHRF